MASEFDLACLRRRTVVFAIAALALAFAGSRLDAQQLAFLWEQLWLPNSTCALQRLSDRCKQGVDTFGIDPCSELPGPTLEGMSKERKRFQQLERELHDISEYLKDLIKVVGDDPKRLQAYSAQLGVISVNLQAVRELQVDDLAYHKGMLEEGVLKRHDFLKGAATTLEKNFSAQGHNHKSALRVSLYNPGAEPVVLELPRGALFVPEERSMQNLVLRDVTRIEVASMERKDVGLYAFCGNSRKSSPSSDLEAVDYVMNCDLTDQDSLWKALGRFSR